MTSVPIARLRQVPRRYSRGRLGVVRALEATARALGGRRLYRRRYLAAGRFAVRREIIAVAQLPAALEGLRCVQLSDLHAGPFLRAGDLAAVVAAVNELAPDLVLITGDLITHAWPEALEVCEDLGRLRARLGVLAVFGNHDYRDRCEAQIAAAFAERGIEFLRNSSRRFEQEGAGLAVVGLEDLEEGRTVDLAAARAAVRPGDVELVLCHNPAGAPALARASCAAVFSGHTHGGQVDLPGLRRIGPAHVGARIALGGTTLIVNRGLGTLGLPLRVGAPTEVVLASLARRAA